MTYPSAATGTPIPNLNDELVFLKNYITNPRIEVGDYTYYHDVGGAKDFETKNVLYHLEQMQDTLTIGKFCSIAQGTRFLMSSSMHAMDRFSTYPFEIFCEEWRKKGGADGPYPYKKNTVVGNDVWFGFECVVLPGVTIGDGAIIGTRATVTKDVPPYTIVGGTPAKVIRQRFDDATIQVLDDAQWWDWPIDEISRKLPAILGSDSSCL